MSGPWEDFQPQAAAVPPAAEDGPWQDFAPDPDALAQAQAAPITDMAPVKAEVDPTDDMSGPERFAAGFGKSYVDLYRGAKQAATELVSHPVNIVARLQAAMGDGATAQRFAGPVNRSLAQQQAEIDEAAKLDAPLMGTAGGLGGHIVGDVTQVAVPALGLRATGLRSAALPSTIRGNAVQGAVIGALQPVETGGSRQRNAAIGAAAGAGGAAAAKAVAGAARSVRGVLEPLAAKGQERIVARTLARSAVDLPRVMTPAPSAVPGVQRTLAEETLDPGIAQLERQFTTQLADLQLRNNQSRVALLEQRFGGASPEAAATLRQARDAASRQTLRPIDSVPLGGLDRVTAGVDALAAKHQAAPAVRAALQAVKDELPNIRTVGDAHAVRQYIGQLIGGQVEGKAGAKLAKRELMTVQGLLDREMRASFPQWSRFLLEHAAASRKADQVDVGARLLARAGVDSFDAAGQPMRALRPAQFRNVTDNMDALVSKTTGFRPGTAANTLTQAQRDAVGAVREDLNRVIEVGRRGRATGSDTAANMATRNTLSQMPYADSRLGRLLLNTQAAQRITTPMEKTYGLFGVPERLQSVLVDALSDPARARVILQNLGADDRRVVQDALVRVGGGVSAALAE